MHHLIFLNVILLGLTYGISDAMRPSAPEKAKPVAFEIFGHRGWGASGPGCVSRYPENSLAAFERAARASKVEGVELDVWLTKDEQVVVIHGKGEYGLLGETTMASDAISGKGIEELTLEEIRKHNGHKLRESWSAVNVQYDAKPEYNIQYEDELARAKADWETDKIACAYGSEVPLLKDVLEQFHKRLLFNVELKGHNRKLGLKVLEIAKKYPGTIARISSFDWKAPVDITRYYGEESKVDLLEPLINNDQRIPLALLFDKDIPDPATIVKCLNKYNAQWAHLRYDAGLYVQDAHHKLPDTDNPYLNFADLVKELHKSGKKVLAWSTKCRAEYQDMRKVLRAGVDALCPNDLLSAVILKEEAKSKDAKRCKK